MDMISSYTIFSISPLVQTDEMVYHSGGGWTVEGGKAERRPSWSTRQGRRWHPNQADRRPL